MLIAIIAIIAVLSLAIYVHELGHFWAARKTGTKVEEFGFGYPPRIFGIKKGETLYSINWIPFGGFVKIKGAEGESDKKPDQDSFLVKKIWQRAFIMYAGVMMNVVLAIVLFSITFMTGSPGYVSDDIDPSAVVSDNKIQILSVEEGYPAKEAGLEVGSVIVSIDGQELANIDQLNDYNRNRANQLITLEIEDGNELQSIQLVLKENEDRGVMGVSLIEVGLIKYPFFSAIWLGIKSTFTYIALIFIFIFNLFKGLLMGQSVAGEVTGPIGVAFLTSRVVKLGFNYLVQFTAIISVNLAVLNILPIPALDGSRLMFLLIEKIRKKRVSAKFEGMFHTVGFGLLIVLSVFVAFQDWRKFFGN